MTQSEIAIILSVIIIPLGLSVYVIFKATKGIEKAFQKQAALVIGIIQGILNLSKILLNIDKLNQWTITEYLFIVLSIAIIILVVLLDKITKNLIKRYYESN